MKKRVVFIAILVILALLALNSMFTVRENEYACTVRFSKIIDTTDQAGLHFKIPFVAKRFFKSEIKLSKIFSTSLRVKA